MDLAAKGVNMPVMTNDESRRLSGSVDVEGGLTCLLYLLMRDRITPGVMEQIVMDIEKATEGGPIQYTNGWLVRYAEHLTERIRKVT